MILRSLDFIDLKKTITQIPFMSNAFHIGVIVP
jgi:hypothetical protein